VPTRATLIVRFTLDRAAPDQHAAARPPGPARQGIHQGHLLGARAVAGTIVGRAWPADSSNESRTRTRAVWKQEKKMRRGNVVAAKGDSVVLPADRRALPCDTDGPGRRA
jgi:hypothetical protein